MEVVLSQADINRLNVGKKRPLNLGNSKDDIAKRNKAAGQQYQGRNGQIHAALVPPTATKKCIHCAKEGCTLPHQTKLALFAQFRRENNHGQNKILGSCINITSPQNLQARSISVSYSVPVNGRRIPVCKITLMDIFQVSKKKVRVIAEKLREGDNNLHDHRGKHHTRPHRKEGSISGAPENRKPHEINLSQL